jgi:hypothetical protein
VHRQSRNRLRKKEPVDDDVSTNKGLRSASLVGIRR